MSFCSIRLCLFIILVVIGVISLVFGILAFILVPKLIDKEVEERTYLGRESNGTDNIVLKMFRDPPYDIKLQIWTFSTQNVDEVINKGKRPIVEEKGPYTFSVLMHKTNISFDLNNTRLFFRNQRNYFFNANQSCINCSLSDWVTVPNILFQKIIDISIGQSFLIRKMIELLIRNKEKVFINVTVAELLFDGYEDELIKNICSKIPSICKALNVPERIGLFYGQNGTDDGLYEVNTGLNNVNLLDKVYSWNGQKGKLTNNYWYGEQARMINGTDAELFKTGLYSGENLEISFEIEKQSIATTSNIHVFRYSQPKNFLDFENQQMQGFCNPNAADYFHNSSIQKSGCAPSGLLEMSTCLPGQPRILWSNSHFLNAPEALLLKGMNLPSINDYSYFDIEPITGVVVGVQQKSQLNLGMLRGDLSITRKMRDLIVPIIWINESAIIDNETREQLQIPIRINLYTYICGWVLTLFGIFCSLIIGSIAVKQCRRLAKVRNEIFCEDKNISKYLKLKNNFT
uniref:CD36 family protein n=1 Tax=Meloidogyne hapla TaxID=6305 RepID=A0A1I8C0J0_MELHA